LGCVRPSKGIRALGLAAGLSLAALPALADAPQRVVSMNLCTDQLALMLAAPGQLISVSDIARDPLTSPMADAAADVPINHGGAEQIYLLNPDLVVASIYSNPAVLDMLRRLGIRVEQLDIVQTLDEVPERVADMGALLGREARADAIIAQYQADLAALTTPPDGPRAAFYYPNGYTLGTGSMSDQILTRAGFRNIADELSPTAAGRVALELLVLADPALIVSSANYAGASRSEAILSHPALQSVIAAGEAHTSTADWVCGTPHVIRAIRDLAETRTRMTAP
jgi:iron complex transport system substrate-binding protein